MTTAKTFSTADLRQFTGSEHWYRHALVRSMLFTDGAKYVADAAGAYWLLDEIALAQRSVAAVKAEGFQLWRLAVNDHVGTLTCENGNGQQCIHQDHSVHRFPRRRRDLLLLQQHHPSAERGPMPAAAQPFSHRQRAVHCAPNVSLPNCLFASSAGPAPGPFHPRDTPPSPALP